MQMILWKKELRGVRVLRINSRSEIKFGMYIAVQSMECGVCFRLIFGAILIEIGMVFFFKLKFNLHTIDTLNIDYL